MRREDPWEFEHPQARLSGHERSWAEYWREAFPNDPIPTIRMVCPQCDGKGASSLYLGSFTQSEMEDQDPDFFGEYMGGQYDRTCESCSGHNVVEVADTEAMNPEMLAEYTGWMQDNAECDAIQRQEWMMGA